jgi:glycosyltransferase involved in cell wall biosynthesis
VSQSGPRIAVIVPAYGVAHLLGEALASLQAQTVADWEAIVIDDGAPDDVAGACAAFADDPRIHLLMTDNGGVAVARNRAIAASQAPYVALLDGDDAYEPDYLATMLAAIEQQPDIGFVTCDAVFTGLADRAGQRFSHFHPQAGAITLDRVIRREFNVFIGCTIRRSALDGIGGYDPALRSAEDLDLWIRLLAAGWGARLVAEPLVRYRRRPGSLSSNETAMLDAGMQVYEKAVAALAGRPEQAAARAMLAPVLARQSWIEGEALILAGDTRRGLELLRGLENRSLRWQLAMPLMRLFPALAAPMLRMRSRLPEPSRR